MKKYQFLYSATYLPLHIVQQVVPCIDILCMEVENSRVKYDQRCADA